MHLSAAIYAYIMNTYYKHALMKKIQDDTTRNENK